MSQTEPLDMSGAAFCAEIAKRVVGPNSGAVFKEFLHKVKNEDSPSEDIEDLLVKLKDVKTESNVYKPQLKLQAGQVFNLPQLYDGADVSSEGSWQETKTALMAQELKLTLNVRTLRHYRIVVEYLPYTLDQFKTTKGLVSALRDAAQTHREAVEKADILHRDVSVGNIMMKEGQGVMQGYLIDWDLSLDGKKAGVENE
ncbi:hypothetical protein C0991_010305, partial [Blastosporella zonata]